MGLYSRPGQIDASGNRSARLSVLSRGRRTFEYQFPGCVPSHDEREQTLNQLLVEMDGFESNEGVILIAATNRPDVLDPALLRPGRFDRQVMVPTPDLRGRRRILEVHTKRTPLAGDVDLEVLARGTPGFSGADLENLVNEAALQAAKLNQDRLDMHDFEYAKDKVLMGRERRSLILSEEEKRITAYHEGGHALAARLLPGSDPVHKVTIIPRGRALGVTMQLPEEDRHGYSRTFLRNNLVVLLGGRVAEEIIFDDITTGASNDIERVTRMLPPGTDAASEEFCLLRVDPPWPVRPSAKRQIEVLDYLHQHGSVSRRRLVQSLGQAVTPALHTLLEAGHVNLARDNGVDDDDALDATEQSLLPPPPAPFVLNDEQARALESMLEALRAEEASSRLLFGVTGSGKTAVYLELAKACLAAGKSVMLLAPEVALAHKLRRDATCALPDAPLFFYHGYQSPARREATFRQMAQSDTPCIVVGTRSALFLPVPHLNCIVLDEEHDGSFKQDESLAYQAKEVAC